MKHRARSLLRLVFIFLLARPLIAGQSPDAGLEGTVVKVGTNEPVSKVTLELRGSETLSTTTENDGKFYFPKIRPGTYRLVAWRDGYWNAEFGQRWVDGPGQPITLGPGDKFPDIRIEMTAGAVISGRVTNNLGQPLAGAHVRAMKPWIRENQRQLRVVNEVIANDLGEYRLIWLLPGRYYVSATYVDWPAGSQLTVNPDAPTSGPGTSRAVSRQPTSGIVSAIAQDETYIPIYYPRTADGKEALAIDLPMGADYKGVDINVTPVQTHHVRGVVTNPPEPDATAPPPGAAPTGRGRVPQTPVRLTPLDPNGTIYTAGIDLESGRFDFPKVVPGSYVAYIFLNGLTVKAPVEVRGGDVDGVSLTISSGVNIPVRVAFDGDPPPNMQNLANLRLTLWRDPTLLGAQPMPATAGAGLTLQNIAPGDYSVYVTPLLSPLVGSNPIVIPPQWRNVYVKSIRLGNADVLSEGLHFDRQPEVGLDVVIAAKPATLEGTVMNEKREAIPGAVVTLFAANPANRIVRTDMYKVTSTDTEGHFKAESLPPGDYRVFAWDGVENGSWMDASFVHDYEIRGQTIRIDEGGALKLDLPVIKIP